MNGNTMVIEWNGSNKREVEEAKTLYRSARKEGRIIVDMAGAIVQGFKASLLGFCIMEKALSDTQFSMRIINETGDQLVVWDSNIKKEVKEAEKLFTEYLGKGWKAYAINQNGDRGRRITHFNAELEEVTFDDKEKMSISKFAESFGKVQMLPKTRAA